MRRQQLEELDTVLDDVVGAVETILQDGSRKAMTLFNQKVSAPTADPLE
jgi:hypothetical protein